MDSGCTVPTLSSGLRETLAVKLLMTARGRRDGAAEVTGAVTSARISERLLTALMLRLRARFLAEDSAGNSRAAMTAMTAMTTRSSIRVKACLRVFIWHQS